MHVLPKAKKGDAFLPVEAALGLMISFGSLIATIIFGILAVVNNNQKNNRPLWPGERLFFNSIKLVTILNGAVIRGVVIATPLFHAYYTNILL
ncbi:hypothetical protein D920_00330 [Enterococcus faecalis 13-SD-W-01]|nr:hypothetical protein D920_00330 [Enterococcus faecalis 13-SD-W-01]